MAESERLKAAQMAFTQIMQAIQGELEQRRNVETTLLMMASIALEEMKLACPPSGSEPTEIHDDTTL